jgi:hypothetical protein
MKGQSTLSILSLGGAFLLIGLGGALLLSTIGLVEEK